MQVSFACNDANGNLDRCSMIEVGDGLMLFHGDMEDGDRFRHLRVSLTESPRFSIGNFESPFTFYQEYVGNIHWNAYEMQPRDVVRLLHWLQPQPHWTLEEAESGLHEKWERGESITVKDLRRASE